MPVALITVEELLNDQGAHSEMLNEAGFEVVYPKNSELARGLCGEQESVDELSVADAVIAGSERFTAAMMQRLPRLRVIARCGVGFDNVDVQAATANNIAVTITPTAVHDAAAEHALALLFAISKKITIRDRATRAGQWPRDLVEPIRGKTIGILGLGRIGRSMAIRSKALGMSVIAHDAYPNEDFAKQHNIRIVDFDSLIQQCDVLSIHCPMTNDTLGMVNTAVFDKMRSTSILVNTARGPIVNETDLVDALRKGKIKAAGLDVYEQEPPAKDNPLFELDNVVLTPHTAGCDRLSMQNMANEAADSIVRLHRANWPEAAVVNPELRDGWRW